jgi:hypothetical protein
VNAALLTDGAVDVPSNACWFGHSLKLSEPETSEEPADKIPFRGKANSGGVIEGHWYWGNFAIDMAGVAVNRQDLPVLRDHRTDHVIGYTTKIETSDEGIDVEGFLVPATEAAREVIAQLKAGVPFQMSVYLPVRKSLSIAEGQTELVNGRKLAGPATIIKNSVLREATITALGADEATSAVLLSDRSDTVRVEVQTLREEQERETMGAKNEPTAAPHKEQQSDQVDPAVHAAAEVQKERERVAFAMAKGEHVSPELLQQAISEGWDKATIAEKFLDHVAEQATARRDQLTAEAPESTAKPNATERRHLSIAETRQKQGEASEAETSERALRAKFRSDADLQAQFFTEDDYVFAKTHQTFDNLGSFLPR